MIELSAEQRKAVQNGKAVHVTDPDIGETVVVLREEDYQRLQDLLEEIEDCKEQAAFLRASHASAVEFMKDNPY
jgi:hypothetical protein